MSDAVPIRRVKRQDPLTGLTVDSFAVPALAIATPQGKKLIPNPAGNEAFEFSTLEEAEETIHRAGFDSVFEGRHTYHMPAPSKAVIRQAVAQGDPLRAAIPLLIARLSDKEPTVVANAAYALGELAAGESAQALTSALGHEDPVIRKSVAEAFAKLGSSGLNQLKKAWQQNGPKSTSKIAPYVRLTVMSAYAHMAQLHPYLTQEILPLALEGLEDDSWLVRAQAALVIGQAANQNKHME